MDDFGGEVHKVSASKAMRNHAHIEADAIALLEFVASWEDKLYGVLSQTLLLLFLCFLGVRACADVHPWDMAPAVRGSIWPSGHGQVTNPGHPLVCHGQVAAHRKAVVGRDCEVSV